MARGRVKKFSALVGMIAVTSMLVLFFLAVPSFLTTTVGQVFSFSWLLIAVATLAGFGMNVFQRKQRKRVPVPSHLQETRTRKISKPGRNQGQSGISFSSGGNAE
jgi:hypothetical protein